MKFLKIFALILILTLPAAAQLPISVRSTNGVSVNLTNIGNITVLSNTAGAQSAQLVSPIGFVLNIGDYSIWDNDQHSVEKELQFGGPGSASWSYGLDASGKADMHFGGSGSYHTYWRMQYDLPTGGLSPAALLGHSTPLGFTFAVLNGGNTTPHYNAFVAQPTDTNGGFNLEWHDKWNGQSYGYNQAQQEAVDHIAGYFASNLFNWGAAQISNNVAAGSVTAVTNVDAPVMHGSNLFLGNTTNAIIFGSGASTNCFLGQSAANTLAITVDNGSGVPTKMFEVGNRLSGTGTLRNASSAITVDWINRMLSASDWTVTPGNLIISAAGKGPIAQHYAGSGTAPTVVTNSGAGGGTGTVTLDARASDAVWTVTLTTGGLATPVLSATIFTVTFNTAYTTAPHVGFSPANSAAALLSGVTAVYVPDTTTTTTCTMISGTTALTGVTVYKWTMFVMQ